MRKAFVAILVMLPLVSGSLVGCTERLLQGSGNLKTEEMDFTGFTRIEVGNAFSVEVIQSDSYSVSITADDNLFDGYIRVSQAGKTLKINLKPSITFEPVTLKAKVTMPGIRKLTLSMASKATITGFDSSEDLEIALSGASSLEMNDITTGDIQLDLSHASKVTGDVAASGDVKFNLSAASKANLTGSAHNMVINASAASQLNLDTLRVHNANVILKSASRATVNLGGRLDANLNGASKLKYTGNPIMGNINTSGGSTLSKK